MTVAERDQFFISLTSEMLHKKRNRIIYELYYSLGLRLAELINLEITDLNFEDGYVLIRNTKNKESRSVPIVPNTIQLLQSYLMEIRPELDKKKSPFLFLSVNGNKMEHPNITTDFKQSIEVAGLTKKLSIHSLRYSIATHLLDNGMDIRYVQRFLGHRSINTTKGYTKVTMQTLRHVVDTFHPSMKNWHEEIVNE